MSKKILVVDDDRTVLRSLKKVLEKAGYSVTVADNAQKGLDLTEQISFDLIVSDIRMPNMSGIEMLRSMRSDPHQREKSPPAVIITGYAGEESSRQDEVLGITGYLYKPFEIDELINTVKKSLEKTPSHKRKYPRISVDFPVKTTCVREKISITGEAVTLSEGGICFKSDKLLSSDKDICVQLKIPSIKPCIEVDVSLVWAEMREAEEIFYYGLKFADIKDKERATLQQVLSSYKALSENFIKLTKELHNYVKDAKRRFDDFDAKVADEKERIEFLKEHKGEIFNKFTKFFDDLWMIAKDFDSYRYTIHKDYFQQTLHYLLRDPIEVNYRIYHKPLGYPGDYIIMNYIYDYNGDGAYLGNSTYQKLINHYTCNIPIACSNVARKVFLKKEIREAIKNNKSPSIMSIACGSGQEIIELVEEGAITKQTCFKCLDFEIKALEFIENKLKGIVYHKKRLLAVEYLHKDIMNIIRNKKLREEIKDNNLIYLSGIYDYLNDRLAERLLRELYSLLPFGGKLIVCNISLENARHRAYYEFLGEWCMVHRTEKQMMNWTCGLKDGRIHFAYPSKGKNYHFLCVEKTNH